MEEIKRLIEERDVLAAEIEDLLTRIDILTEKRDVAEDKLEVTLFEIEGLKEEMITTD